MALRFPFQKFALLPKSRLQCDSRRARRLMVSTLQLQVFIRDLYPAPGQTGDIIGSVGWGLFEARQTTVGACIRAGI